MDIPLQPITGAIGHTIVYESYKGDYAEALRLAEAALAESRDPDALLACGVAHLLQGNARTALGYFQELELTVGDDSAYRLRALYYQWLVETAHYNLFPEFGGANSSELELRWNGVERLKALQQQRNTLAASSGTTLEEKVVFSFLPQLQSTRSFVQSSRYTASGISPDMLLNVALGGVDEFAREAEQLNASPSIQTYAHVARADLCRRAGLFDRALQDLGAARQMYESSGDAAGVATCYLMQGDMASAPFSSPLVWNFVVQESSTSGSELAWTLELREFNIKEIDAAAARVAYTEAERAFDAAGAQRGVAYTRLRYGYLAMLAGDFEAVINCATEAAKRFEVTGDQLGFWLATAHRLLGRIGAGQLPEEQETALQMGRWGATKGSLSFTLGLGLFLGRVGRHWLIRRGDYERALACFRLAERVFKGLNVPTNQAQSFVDQGSVYEAIGDRDTSLTWYEAALDVLMDIPPASRTMVAQVRTVTLLQELYDLHLQVKNAEGMEGAIARMEKLTALYGLAATNMEGASGADATDNMMGMTLVSLRGGIMQQGGVLAPLYRAVSARNEGDAERARAFFEEARQKADQAVSSERDFLTAVVLATWKQYGAAKEAFERFLGLGGMDAGFMGALSAFLSQAGGTAGSLEQQRQQTRTWEQAFSFMVRVKAYEDAATYLKRLEDLDGKRWWQRDEQPWKTLSDIGEMYEGLTQYVSALEYYDRAIEELEKRRNVLGRDGMKRALGADTGVRFMYFQAVRAALALHRKAIEANNPEQALALGRRAFAYAEQNKARALLDLMADSLLQEQVPTGEASMIASWRERNAQLEVWRGLLAKLRKTPSNDPERVSMLEQQVADAEEKVRELEVKLAREEPGFFTVVNAKAEVISLDTLMASLPANTAVLYYNVLGEDLLMWAVTNQGMHAADAKQYDAYELARNVTAFQKACANKQDPQTDARTLAALLLEPFSDLLGKHRELIIVPYGPLHLLPFHVLPWNGNPLAHTHTVRYLPNASTLKFTGNFKEKLQQGPVLAVGNPSRMKYRPQLDSTLEDARPLPASATEAAYVARLFEGKSLLEDEATEKAVREELRDYSLLHFATHGYLSEEAPLLSRILLAEGEALTVFELMGLHLDADLVVLSACQTARGDLANGEDVVGLTRGLLGAGARSAVVSLWPVADVATCLFMGAFYRALREDHLPASALKAAQSYMRHLKPGQIDEELARIQAELEEASVAPEISQPVLDKLAERALAKQHELTATRDLTGASDQPAPLDYTLPYYWAPFILVG